LDLISCVVPDSSEHGQLASPTPGADRVSWLGGLFAFKRMLSWEAAGFALIPVLAALVTWVSGFVLTYRSSNGVISQSGLPLFWKTRLEYPGSVGFTGVLRVPFSITIYSLGVFVLDMLLYAGIGYSVILWRRGHQPLLRSILIPVSAAWLAYATLFFSWSSQYGTWTNGLPLPWMGFWSEGWFYNWIGFAFDVAFIAAFEYFALFLYRGFRMIVVASEAVSPGPLPQNVLEICLKR